MKLNIQDLFKDLTWMQIGAGALAAATSFFLSSSIGIAGSLIGAAVGSVVTTFSSAIYKSLFTASDEAIKKKIGVEAEAAPDDQADAGEKDVAGEKNATDETGPVGAHFAASAQPALETPDARGAQETQEAQATQAIPPAQATHKLPGTPAPVAQAPAAPAPLASHPGTDPDELQRVRSLVAQRKSQRLNRIVTAVSLATGLAAVALCAVVILGATSGNGIGYRPAPTVRAPEPVVVDQTGGIDPAGNIEQSADQSADAPADVPANAPATDGTPGVDGSTTVTGPTTDGADEANGAGETTGSGDHEQIPGDAGTSGQEPSIPEPGSPNDNADGPDSPNDPNTSGNVESPGANAGDTGDSYATDTASETPAALIVAE